MNILSIEGELNIYRAAELRDVLVDALKTESDLEINLAGVTEMDSAGVQVLMAAKKTAQASGHNVSLVGHSPIVLEIFELLDLAAHFGDPLLVPAVG